VRTAQEYTHKGRTGTLLRGHRQPDPGDIINLVSLAIPHWFKTSVRARGTPPNPPLYGVLSFHQEPLQLSQTCSQSSLSLPNRIRSRRPPVGCDFPHYHDSMKNWIEIPPRLGP
jgi:hypothetical protein